MNLTNFAFTVNIAIFLSIKFQENYKNHTFINTVTYRIMSDLKVETDTSIAASRVGRTAIVMIMYVETYKSDFIVFIGKT